MTNQKAKKLKFNICLKNMKTHTWKQMKYLPLNLIGKKATITNKLYLNPHMFQWEISAV